MTLSNLFESQLHSLRSHGVCMEEPYAYDIVMRHREEEAAAKRKIVEIKARYEAMRISDGNIDIP